ncbi:MAG: four helix bundle protein [Proteiniphilum sp.]
MGERENIIKEKTYAFALRVIKLYNYLIETNKEYVLSKQILRSGTSIGANVEEAIRGHSKKDFIARIQIAYKEAREVHYWLRLLRESNYIDDKLAESLLSDCEEIVAILTAILKTSKDNS